MDGKEKLRKEYRSLWKQQRGSDEQANTRLRHQLLRFLQKHARKRDKVLIYLPMRDELPLFDWLKSQSYHLYFPKLWGSGLLAAPISGKQFSSLNKSKTLSYNSIAKRKISSRYRRILPLFQMDWIIVPGLFVNREGFRLGRGGGYYDRALSFFHKSHTVFVARDWQLREDFPVELHDKPAGWVIYPDGWRYSYFMQRSEK